MEPQESLRALADDIYRGKVDRARSRSPGEKLFEGFEIFNYARTFSDAGIRSQMPTATDEEVRQEFVRRLNLIRKLEEVGWTKSPPSAE